MLAVRGPLRTGSLTLAYEPRIFITLNQVPGQSSNSVSYLHRGHFILDLKPTPLWRWFIETRTAYGEYDFSPLSTVIPQTGGTLLPPSQPTLPGAPPVVRDQLVQFAGFKLFYRQDAPLLAPRAVLNLDPSPDLVIYQ